MMKLFSVAMLAAIVIIITRVAATNPTITVGNLGTVTGSISSLSNDIGVYHAIPYAEPPVGSLRWQPPSYGPKFGDLNGTKYGNRCMSNDPSFDGTFISEDCLLLNVAAPITATDSLSNSSVSSPMLLPVMLWIHGGTYVSGSSNTFTPDSIVAASNSTVVVVTVNYRLSIFGFLAGDEVASRTSDKSQGNFGIQDQRAAMRWVHDHIAAFGGDPYSVTIFGESAGGNSVYNHLAQSASFPFYHQAIIESGCYNEGAFTSTKADQYYHASLKELQCNDLNCMLNKTANELLAGFDVLWKTQAAAWGPVVDGVNLIATPERLLRDQKGNNKAPVMLGSNRDEMAFWTLTSVPKECDEKCSDQQFAKFWYSQHGTMPNATVVAEVEKIYRFNSTYDYPSDLGDYSEGWWTSTRTATDSVPGLGPCGTRNVARILAARAANASQYVYLFAHPTQTPYPLPGDGPGSVTVGHTTEIPYVFGQTYYLIPMERPLAQTMATYWTNFARTGTPNRPEVFAKNSLVQWPLYSSTKDQVLRFDVDVKDGGEGIHVESGLREAACAWQDLHRVPLSDGGVPLSDGGVPLSDGGSAGEAETK